MKNFFFFSKVLKTFWKIFSKPGKNILQWFTPFKFWKTWKKMNLVFFSVVNEWDNFWISQIFFEILWKKFLKSRVQTNKHIYTYDHNIMNVFCILYHKYDICDHYIDFSNILIKCTKIPPKIYHKMINISLFVINLQFVYIF